MTHTLRKYLSNRGSALFMVLSTMTALMMAVMAMYFSVVSSRTVQYGVFYQNQAYQSAVSVQDALVNWMSANSTNDLGKAMMALAEGETLTTNGNGFEAFGVAGGNEEQDQVGAYDVNITKVKPETVSGVTCTTFDVATTVYVGGVKETVHIYWHVPPSEVADSKVNSDIFASTGYISNNADVASGKFATRSVFDNEYVNFGNGDGEYKLYGDVFCGGSVEMNRGNSVNLEDVLHFVVRDSFHINNVSTFNLGKDGEKGQMYVGYYLYVTGGFNLNNMDIYVIHDVYWEGGMNTNGGSTLNIDGDFYYTGGVPDRGNIERTININGRIYCRNSIDDEWEDKTDYYNCNTWADEEADAAVTYINSTTDSYEFSDWKIEESEYPSAKDILFNSGAGECEVEIKFSGDSNGECYTHLGDIRDIDESGSENKNYTIFIDTGDDEENRHYIMVDANLDCDGDDVDETFCWNPLGLTKAADAYKKNVNILVRGKGSVIIDIPDGVTYASSSYEKFMHYGWYLILGGTTNPNGGYSIEMRNRENDVQQFLHVNCLEGCGDCDYDVNSLTTKCSECGTYQKEVVCERHNYRRVFCPNTDCELNENDPADDEGNYDGLCSCRIDRDKVRSYINSHGAIKSIYPTDTSGDYIYPNCNIFLVSTDRSAAIYIADYPVMDPVTGAQKETIYIAANSYFGYVYAPYMTYKGYHDGEENPVRFCGGMVVSDYIFNDNSWYLNCYPDRLPSELGASGSLSHDEKAWKIIVGRN